VPTIRLSDTLAIGASDSNIIAGSKFEFMPTNMAVTIFAVQDGAATGALTLDVTFGNAVEGDDLAVPDSDAVGTGPDRDKHLIASGVAAAGDRLQLKLVNGDAVAASNYRVLVDLRPI
jgi:hypothetical protein